MIVLKKYFFTPIWKVTFFNVFFIDKVVVCRVAGNRHDKKNNLNRVKKIFVFRSHEINTKKVLIISLERNNIEKSIFFLRSHVIIRKTRNNN